MTERKAGGGKRTRRSAEDARAAILDAAERRLSVSGPAGIRLQEVAADVGVSHPTVLHHFGSREALVQAVVTRAFGSLHAAVVEAIGHEPQDDEGMGALLTRIFRALEEGGHARVMAWLALEGVDTPTNMVRLDAVVQAADAIRRLKRQSLGLAPRDSEDTAFVVLLTTFVLFGQAVVGPALFDSAGLAGAEPRFQAWLGKLLKSLMERD